MINGEWEKIGRGSGKSDATATKGIIFIISIRNLINKWTPNSINNLCSHISWHSRCTEALNGTDGAGMESHTFGSEEPFTRLNSPLIGDRPRSLRGERSGNGEEADLMKTNRFRLRRIEVKGRALRIANIFNEDFRLVCQLAAKTSICQK